MTDHPLKLREAVNVADFNRREELLGRIWMLKDRVKREIARIARWNAKHPDEPISDAFERGVLDYLDSKGPMPDLAQQAKTRTIHVRCEVGARYRFNMVNAETGEQIGTVNTRPHDTWAMTDEERQRRVVMYCELANGMYPATTFVPARQREGQGNG